MSSFPDDAPFFQITGKYKAKVVRVYDGDTIHCVLKLFGKWAKIKVRMYGYNSPELRPSKKLLNRDIIIQKAGMARDILKEKLLNKIIDIECIKFDDFGRVLGKVYCDEICVNQWMLDNDYGIPFVK